MPRVSGRGPQVPWRSVAMHGPLHTVLSAVLAEALTRGMGRVPNLSMLECETREQVPGVLHDSAARRAEEIAGAQHHTAECRQCADVYELSPWVSGDWCLDE